MSFTQPMAPAVLSSSFTPTYTQGMTSTVLSHSSHFTTKSLPSTGPGMDIVNALNLSHAIFIGNSVGGFAAGRLAITHPDKVAGLVLVNTGGFVHLDWISRLFINLLGIPIVIRWILPVLAPRYMLPENAEDQKITTQVTTSAKTVEGSKIAASLWKSFLDPGYDLTSQASKVKAPTLIIWGKKDPVVPLKIGQITHEAIKGSKFEVLDTGHVVFASKPDEFLALVEPFLRETLES